MRMTLLEIARAVQGELLPGSGADAVVSGVCADSRADCADRLFIALAGERFDAHDYLEEAAKQNAAAFLIQRADKRPAGRAAILVADTRRALGMLAAEWRRRFAIPVFAVTGSNGKTTTREMLASILREAYGANAVLTPERNFNNDVGLPLTLLRLSAAHSAAALEIGMNHPGEISSLARLALPTAALITNAQRAHLEGMGCLDAIAEEKGAIYDGLTPEGIALWEASSPHARLWREKASGRRAYTFALTDPGMPRPNADLTGEARTRGFSSEMTICFPDGALTFVLRVPGRHNAGNALAAAAAAFAAGVKKESVVSGLERFSGVRGRLEQHRLSRGVLLLDDTYNANPDSVRAGIDVLAAHDGEKILALGDMGEIGGNRAQYHREIGLYAKTAGIGHLYTLGEASREAARAFGKGAEIFTEPDTLALRILENAPRGAAVLVKGSRFMRMERVAAFLRDPERRN
ncbi:MAG: UDP-N-acetylmuramoyl-tripeptide--D-alanyl-D-alanine ligase [Zoogloeaceae bacterium]|nr:UDP-N-acetylmuramoyl-tripeptide--D-alanyl-D-alanine ligase [Zoogloeaceae bacterium]